jgi:HK97 family phage major capsid protein/HK97 family phage prohead protease
MPDIEPINGPPTRLPVPVCRTHSDRTELRANASKDGGMPTMEGHFSMFDNWYQINSAFEGKFMERINPGAFKKTFSDDASRKNAGDKIKCLLEHGHDYTVGDKPLGVPRSLSEDGDGAYYEVPLLDTSYVRDLVPALDAGAYGSSFRFRVLQDEWVEEPERSDSNPEGIPERTIKEVRVMEFGPTMFPANSSATAGMRSTTDDYYAALRARRPEEFDTAMRSVKETRESLAAERAAAEKDKNPGRSDSCDCEAGALCYHEDCACPGTADVLAARSELVVVLTDVGFEVDQAQAAMPPHDTVVDDVRAQTGYLASLIDSGYTPDQVVEWVRADDPAKPYGSVVYADPGYQKDKKKRYPLDTKEHVNAAWSYINQSGNAAKYDSGQVAEIKGKIKAAAKKFGITIADEKKSTTPAVKPGGTPKPGAATTAAPRSRESTPTPPKTKEVQRSARMDELTMTVAEREQRQAEIRTRLAEIDAEYNGAELPEERQTEWDDISAEFDVHTHAIRAANARSQRLASLAGNGSIENGTGFEAPNVTKRKSAENVYDLIALRRDARSVDDLVRAMRDNALRAVEMNHYDSVNDEDACRTHIERLLRRVDDKDGTIARSILQTGSETYDRAFGKMCFAGSTDVLSNEERAALAVGATTTGGFAVPFNLDPTVILTDAGVVNPIRQIARVVTIAGKQWQGVTSAGITVSRAAEAAEAGDNSPTLAQPTVTPTRVQGFVPFSFEVDQDWSQMRGELATMFNEAKDTEEATAFVTGSGVDPNPEGVITGVGAVGGSVVAGGSSVAFGTAEIYSLVDALPPRHVANASWLGNKKAYNKVRQIDDAGGADLWARIAEGRPSRLVDFPVYEASTMSATFTATNKVLLLGDFKKFLIVDRIGMSVELIPHLFHTGNNRPSGQRGLYAIWRNSSKVLDPNAFRLLQLTA